MAPPHSLPSLATTPLQPSIETFGPHRGAVTAVVVTPDASRLVTGGVDCTLVVWSIRTRTSLHIVAVREPVVALLPLLLAPVFAATSQLPQPSAFKKSVTPVSQLAVQLPALCGVDVRSSCRSRSYVQLMCLTVSCPTPSDASTRYIACGGRRLGVCS
jgi:WD40 repeat protein